MISFLKSKALAKPTTIASGPTTSNPKYGRVTSNIAHGELFLHPKGKSQARIRLRWTSPKDRERELPAGTYTLMGYRHVATAKDGVQWIWSTTSPAYGALVVEAGKVVTVTVRERIGVRARAFEKRGKHRVALAFESEKGLGHTLYRAGRRIDITWQCLDAKASVLAKGTMRYG